MLSGLLVPVILLAVIAMMIFKVIPEYERAVVLRLGRALPEPKGPGLIILIPFVDKMIKISVRTVTMDIDPQDVITRDNVSLKVNAVVYFRVVAPLKAFVNVENYLYATSQLAQTHLRSILGEHSFDDVLKDRDGINTRLQKTLDENTDSWGIKVVSVEIKHVDLPADMQRAMAKEAEAEREKRAKIIAAEGELQAAEKLKLAADELSKNPATLQLRYLQTLSNMSSEQTTTIVFPLPIEMFKSFMK
jgi:regulator of protease activity HflC (stomatin/prohibitin superfamily)